MFLSSSIILSKHFSLSCGVLPSFISCCSNFGLPDLSVVHVRLAYFVLIYFVLNNFVRGHGPLSGIKSLTPAKIFFGRHTTRVKQLVAGILIFILLLTFLMIAIVNTSLLNPGPQNLKVYYQNVQGLIPFSNLSSVHPVLDRTKICELNLYVHINKPDIVILNETWLKRSIRDHEVIEDTTYKIFRKDRTILSHPNDPNNPDKFRKNGGGVLIAIRSDLVATTKRISLRNGAEILAIEVAVNGSKLIFCTCYRVGTLGPVNHGSISDSIRSFYKCKKPKKIFIIGDFNLSSVIWPLENLTCSNNTEKLFIDTFNELGLTQCIEEATHAKGKVLDLLLTNHLQLISNLSILEQNSTCKSDHFPITFEVKTKVKRKKPTKRKIYNFKRANWEALNDDLCNVNWDAMLNSAEPDLAWSNFKGSLFYHVNKHIPTMTIKSEFKPPWFDCELHEACKTKERARQKFKITNSKLDEIKFANARREFKFLNSKKMRENMYNTDDPALKLLKSFGLTINFLPTHKEYLNVCT